MKKRTLTILILAAFLLGATAPAALSANTAVTNLAVRPDINTVGEYSRYQINFTTNVELTGGIDTVQIRFPSEYRSNNINWQSGGAEVNGVLSGGMDYTNGLLTILIPRNMTIRAGDTVVVGLSPGVVRNPSAVGEYSLSVSTSKETVPVDSPRFSISEYVNADGVSRPHVTLTPVRGYQAEEIAVKFTTNRSGQLIGSVDQIILEFPSGFRLPQVIDERHITINGIQMHGLSPAVTGQRLILPLSPTMNFTEMHLIEIVIAPNSGVTIDRNVSDARMWASTTRNTATVESFPFNMSRTPDQIYIPADDKDPGVTVAPNGAGALGQWTFTFPRNTILLTQGNIVMGFTIVFPNGVVLPGSIAAQHITVNGQQSAGVLVTPNRREVIFNLPVGFSTDFDITVAISSGAGIQNPPAAVYHMEIGAFGGIKTFTTKAFEIKTVSDAVTDPQSPQGQQPPPFYNDKVVKLTLNDPIAVSDGSAVILDVAPQLIDGFTMVPLRFVTEGLGAVVDYDATQNTVTLNLGNRSIVLWPGSTLAKVDNVVVTLAKAPIIREDRTMVPVRFVSECFGAMVDYISPTDPITITMTPDALTKMPAVADIQAGQAAAAGGAGSGGAGSGAGSGSGSGSGSSSGSGSGTGSPGEPGGGGGAAVGKTIALKSGSLRANLRSGPGTSYDMVGYILPTETAKILEIKKDGENYDWYHVEFNYNFKAWVRSDLVDVM
ncbi:MAG: stalk domain-containing protein [Clostridiales bacterium]|nr:stalk domain-containing protein [Clostridiales bacterium]